MKKIDKISYYLRIYFVILSKAKELLLLIAIFFFIATQTSFAASPYVLPYPSAMPGGVSYKLHIVWEKIMQYWYFGDFGQYTYNLKESDKYLVEAKTLFEYNQYLLGFAALQKSNTYFAHVQPFLEKAKQDGKNITENQLALQQAAAKHIEVLQKMENETPSDFTWTPEKNPSSTLHIHQLIQQAIEERQKDL
ncbi:MAG TPA: hypothetical protein VLB73_02630 [Patescibacteria group bacterium]|nr:hypothetical protein [Patescibacteria group bacterium]